MSRQFSLATVIRMTTNELLQAFFEKLGNPCWSMDWTHRPRRHVDSVLQCLSYFSPEDRTSAELIFRQVFELACPSGLARLRESAFGSRIEGQIPEFHNPYCQALWVWLHAPRVFDQAYLYHQVECLSSWTKRGDFPCVTPNTDATSLEALGTELTRLLTKEEGRGHRCTVEHCRREDGADYYFCFPDDYPRTVQTHNRRGQLVSRTIQQTFEIVFAYRQEAGTLELHAKVPKRLKPELEDAFAWLILEERLAPSEPRPVYDLNRLLDRSFRFETDPADDIFVQLRRLSVDLPDRTRVMLQPKWVPVEDAPGLVSSYLKEERATPEDVSVAGVTFQFNFRRTTGRERGTMTFDVNVPNTCSLRTHRPDRAAVGWKHLRMWRIAHD
jgi:hypothetical protein